MEQGISSLGPRLSPQRVGRERGTKGKGGKGGKEEARQSGASHATFGELNNPSASSHM